MARLCLWPIGGPGVETSEPDDMDSMCPAQCIRNGIEDKDPALINNRQAGRRNNRGRNNGRPNGNNNRGGGDNGNRIDNRARGNAPQLLEKYRNLARDAQLAGDRVNTEYYLQFADHYFRVIADNRQRQEEQQARFRRNDEPLEYEMEGEAGYEDSAGQDQNDMTDASGADMGEGQQRQREGGYRERGDRNDRGERGQGDRGQNRNRRERRPDYQDAGEAAPAAAAVEGAEEQAPRRRARPARPVEAHDEPLGLDLAVLPPAISRPESDDAEPVAAHGDGEEAAPVRRRGRKQRPAAEAAE